MEFQLSRTKIEMILEKVDQEGNLGIGIGGLIWQKNLSEFVGEGLNLYKFILV